LHLVGYFHNYSYNSHHNDGQYVCDASDRMNKLWSPYVYILCIHIGERVVPLVVDYLTTSAMFIIWLRMRRLLLNHAMKGCSRRNFWLNFKSFSIYLVGQIKTAKVPSV